MAKIRRIIHRNPSEERDGGWVALNCRTGKREPLDRSPGAVFALGPAGTWCLVFEPMGLVLRRTVPHYVPIAVNEALLGDEDGYSLDDRVYSVAVDDGRGRAMAWVVCEAQALPPLEPSYALGAPNGTDWEYGPFPDWRALEEEWISRKYPGDAKVLVEGSAARFTLRHVNEPGVLRPPVVPPAALGLPPTVFPPAVGQSVAAVPADLTLKSELPERPFVPIDKAGSGELVCLYCRERFDHGDYYYFPASLELEGGMPAAPYDYDVLSRPLDALGAVCTVRACPHCGGRLPESFGRPSTKYTIVSLVGQSGAGKSYYIATMGRKLRPALSRHGVDLIDDDEELNAPYVKLCGIPFFANDEAERIQPAPEVFAKYPGVNFVCGQAECGGGCYRRVIDKTDEQQQTQEWVWFEGTRYPVPKPFILRAQDPKSGGVVRLVLYDNAGEDFTQAQAVNRGQARRGKIATGHLAHAKVVLVLYDPLLDPRFRAELGMAPAKKDDDQLPMLTTMARRMNAELQHDGPSKVPLAVLVGKCDAWEHVLTPGLHRDEECYDGDGHLSLSAVQRSSARLIELLDRLDTGIPQAARAISSNVCFFPVSALGQAPVQCFDRARKLTPTMAPPQPAKPRGVEIPMLWGLWKAGLIGDEDS